MILQKIKAINVIEVFIFVFVISLLVFSVKFYTFKPEYRTIRVELVKKNWIENYDPYGYRAPYWLGDRIKIGQTEKNASGQNIAQIVNLENYDKGSEEIELFLTLKVAVASNPRDGSVTFKDKPIIAGSNIELYFNNTILVGQVIDDNVPSSGYPTKTVIATLRARNLDPWVYSKLKPGLQVHNRATNEVIAEITSVKTEEPLIYPLRIGPNNTSLAVYASGQKDAVITARLKVQQFDGRWYYAGHQNLKITSDRYARIYLYTDDITLYELEVQDIKDAI